MAVSSGSFNTSANGNWYATFNWSIASTNDSAGTTTINYNVTAHNAAGKYRTVYQKDLYINGSQVFYRAGTSGNGQSCYEGTVITSGSFTFSGTGLSASFACGVGSYPGTNVSGSGSWSVPEPTPSYWNDVNVYSPAGVQDYASGYFDLYTSANNSWRYNLTNEDSDMTHKKGTYFQVQNIRPYYDYYELDRVEGYDSIPATGAYRKTFDAANEVLSIYMKYKNYYRDINAWNPDKSSQGALMFDYYIYNRDGTLVNSYTNVTNEVANTVTREYGYTGKINNIRSNLTGAHYSSNNITNTAASEFTWTFNNGNAVELYSAWNTYTITIRKGTGISDITSPAWGWTGNYKTGSATYGNSFTINASVSTGYHWSGWTGTYNTSTQSYTFTVNQNVDVTANAVANTYTVKYDANGGEGTTASSSHTYGVAKNLTSNGFTRIGYNFLGWSTSSTATTATYTDGQSVSNLTTTHGATVTLYAVWAMRAPYNVYTDFYTYRDKITVEVAYTGITSNNVIYYKAASASSYSTKDIGTATTYTLTGLQPNTEYYIYIKMTNGGGTTTTGTEIVETKAYVPASPTLTATDTGLTDVTFLMSATAETNAPTTSYTIYQTYKISKNTYDMALCHLSDGSVWARIFYHNTKQGTVLFSSLAEIKSTQTVDKYSRLGQLSEFKRSNGTYEFMLRYPNYSATLYNRWTQTSNPMEEFITTTSDGAGKATGYTAVHIDWTGQYWGGLTRQSSDASSISNCYLSGSVGHSNWYYAIGATSAWGNGIPGPLNAQATGTIWGVAELWVRIDDATVSTNGLGNTSNMTPTLTGLSNGTEYTFWLGVENAGGKNYSSRVDATTSSPIAQLYTKVNGAWKNGDAYFKLNGEWVPVYHVYTKINGAWISNGSPPLVSFKIDGVSYQVRVGMTWSDWCNSSYNKDNYWVNTSGIVTWGSGRAFPTFEGRDIYGTEAVMANYEYGYYSTEK